MTCLDMHGCKYSRGSPIERAIHGSAAVVAWYGMPDVLCAARNRVNLINGKSGFGLETVIKNSKHR